MEKIKLINAKEFFKESEKAIQVVDEYEKEIRGRLPVEDKLKVAKESLEKVKTREEYDLLSQKIKDLEYEVKFGAEYIPAVPEEHQHKIAFNRVQEEEELEKELQKQKELLHELVIGFSDPLKIVLQNIEQLQERRLISNKIDGILEKKIFHDSRMPCPSYYLSVATPSQVVETRKARETYNKLVEALKKMASEPPKKGGILKPTFIEKILGGNK